jgi:hypothetical protein
MFVSKSYIKYPHMNVYDLSDVEKRPLSYFTEIDNLEKMSHIKNDLDLDYIYGAIYFTYNKQIIMDFTYYDLIDHLWAYFLNMIEDFLKNQKSEVSFPDQPLPMSMERLSDDYILFLINFVEWKFPKYEFFNALLLGAKDFFEKMILLIEEKNHKYQIQLKRIKVLEKQIINLKI